VFDVRSGSLILQDLAVRGGFAQNDDGGGIRAKAPLTLNRVHLTSNVADSSGGGIYTEDDLSIVRSTISQNEGDDGSAIGAILPASSNMTSRSVKARSPITEASENSVVPFRILKGVILRYYIPLSRKTN